MQTTKSTVTAHVLVKNEKNYIFYAINSVLPHIDKMIIFDTGSTDKTVEIIKSIIEKDKDKKIIFEEKGEVDKQKHTDLRNEMIKRTTTDWFMILDGDEVWPEEQIKFVIEKDIPDAEKINRNCIMVSFHLCAVDLNHYTESGHYGTNWGLHGHFTYRFFKNVNDIKYAGEYLKDTLKYQNGEKVAIQNNILFSTSYFWHLSKLKRSSRDSSVFSRKKPSKISFLPNFIQKKLVKKYTGEIPKIFYENK